MNDYEPALFAFGEPTEPTLQVQPALPIRPEQVSEIRTAFESAGITDQEDRRKLIQSVILREVANLRELRSIEVRRILACINAKPTATVGSAWDTREEDTWIDKL